jgi:hypothetical protein
VILNYFSSGNISLRIRRTENIMGIKVAPIELPFTPSFSSRRYLVPFQRYAHFKLDPTSKLHRYGIACIETSTFCPVFWVGNVTGGVWEAFRASLWRMFGVGCKPVGVGCVLSRDLPDCESLQLYLVPQFSTDRAPVGLILKPKGFRRNCSRGLFFLEVVQKLW